MTYIERAIRDAVEKGGYKERINDYEWSTNVNQVKVYNDGIFLDALFWSALGKERGWSDLTFSQSTGRFWTGTRRNGPQGMSSWKSYWHRFIDALADGKSAEQFFEEIYKT